MSIRWYIPPKGYFQKIKGGTMEKKRKKASEQPIEEWFRLFFEPLYKKNFYMLQGKSSMQSMKKDSGTGKMPPEYKDRPPNQGMQRKLFWKKNGRWILILSTISWDTDTKKIKYHGWVRMGGKSIKEEFVSSPILDTASFFDTGIAWASAFVDIAMNWPTDPQTGKELVLEHMRKEGIMHMMKFSYPSGRGIKVVDGDFSKETLRFLKKKLMPSYRKQMKEREARLLGIPIKETVPKRVTNAQRRKNAFPKKE